MITIDPDYEILATRIIASNIQKVCPNNFHLAMRKLQKADVITDEVVEVAQYVKDNIKTDRDFDFGYFGLKTLEKSYLQRVDGKLIETPQYLFMRVAIGIHGKDTPAVLETYDKMSQGFFIHATPTLFNSGTPKPQMSSCFLLRHKTIIRWNLWTLTNVLKYLSGLVVSVCISMTSDLISPVLGVPMVNLMELSQCLGYSMQQLVM